MLFADPRPIESSESSRSPPESFALTNAANARLRYTLRVLGELPLVQEALRRRRNLTDGIVRPEELLNPPAGNNADTGVDIGEVCGEEEAGLSQQSAE